MIYLHNNPSIGVENVMMMMMTDISSSTAVTRDEMTREVGGIIAIAWPVVC